MSREPQTYTWRMPYKDYLKYADLVNRLVQEEEWSELYMTLLDEIKSIPGYPRKMDPETDALDIVAVGSPRVGYTGAAQN